MLSSISDNTAATTTLSDVTEEDITIGSTTNIVINETVTIASGVGTITSNVINVTYLGNDTMNTAVSADVDISIDVNFTRHGDLIVNLNNFTDGDYNISYIYLSDAGGATAQDDLSSVSYFGNITINTSLSSININTHVNWSRNGSIAVNTYNFTDGTYQISYKFEDDAYVADSTSRVFLNLIPLFFAIAVMLIMVIWLLKEFGYIGVKIG